jgi:hypothetical protein
MPTCSFKKNINTKLLVNLLIEKKIVHLHPNFERKTGLDTEIQINDGYNKL